MERERAERRQRDDDQWMPVERLANVTSEQRKGRARQTTAGARQMEQERDRTEWHAQARGDEAQRDDEEKNLPLAIQETGARRFPAQEGADFFPLTSK